ncbi:MAG: MGMT family protein, partial [Oscillospiraceae bacterium]|nr:MGMT family protein [Oscillospiraceae bacterium]
ELEKIPFGETKTYGEIAAAIGKPKAARAVGGACNKNHILIAVPCHRVIGAGGKLTGFACGTEVKKWLLGHEAGLKGEHNENRMENLP